MEVTPCIRDVRGHADSLLASLNLQRDQAQFCDCVIRQSSALLFLAHRCVLAASSPVLASLLASNGTLLELQAPCLSDSVLSLVLDYIYTGDLPPPTAQQHYCSLLTAASYLQMDKLKQDLKARQRTNTDDGDNNLTTSSTPAKPCRNIMNDQPFSEDVYSKHRAVEIYTSLCDNSMEKQDHPFSAKTCDEIHRGGERSPTSSSFSPLSCSAVPVICHSGRATIMQPAETATLPHLCPGSQSSSGASIPTQPVPQPASPKEGTHSNTSANYVSTGAGFKDINWPLAQSQHGGNKDKDPFGIQSWNYNEQSLDGCGIQHFDDKPTPVMTLDYKGKPHFGEQYNGNDPTEYGLYQSTDVKDHLVNCGSIQYDNDTNHSSDDEIKQNKDYKDVPNAEGYKDSDDEKHPPGGCFDVQDVSMMTAEPTGGCRSLIVVGSNIGSEYQYGDRCFGGREEAEEDSKRDGHLHRADRMDHVTCQNRTMTHGRDGDQPERESHTALASDTSYDPAYSYSGHTVYHCLSQEYTQQTHTLSYTHSKYRQHAHGSAEPVHQVLGSSSEESSTDSSAVTNGAMHTDLPAYASAATQSTLLISTSRSTPASLSPGLTLLQHPYHCSLCDRAFSQRGSLNRHTRSHLGVRPYPCPRCPMTFSRQYRVTEHMRVHQRCCPDEELQKPPAPPT